MSEPEILGLEDKRFAAIVARFFGEVALIRGRAAVEVDIGGQPKSLRLLFLNAWTRTPQGWKFAAWQSCPMPA